MNIEANTNRTCESVRLEVVRNRLSAIADEMGVTLQRSAYSTNIKTRQDFSCAIFDHRGRMITQSFSQPVHLGSLAHFVPTVLNEYRPEQFRPGDAVICNDGHRGGVHLNDVLVLAPVFNVEQLTGFVATIAHHLDVGGFTPGSIGLTREVFQEGVRIPPIRILVGGELNEDVFRLITNNIRAPKETAGDLRAQICAVNIGVRGLREMISRHGAEDFNRFLSGLLDYSERRVRAEIARIPQGVYEAVGYLDDDGLTDEPVRIVVRIEVQQEKVIFDLTGSDRQRPCPINATYAMTLSNCAYALRVLMDPDLPVNHAFYQAMEVRAPAGSIVNATSPSAISGGWETALRVSETAMAAFAKAVPDRMAAGSKGCLVNFCVGGVSPRTGEYYVFYEAIGGGYGARATKDGLDGIQAHGQNTENSPVEETEAAYPIRITRYELISGSGGDGRFRGGLGIRRDYFFDHEVTVTVLADRVKFAPSGLEGGRSAHAARYVVNPDREAKFCPSKCTIRLQPGDTFSVQTAGGGGYGPVGARNKRQVLEDLLEDKITPGQAREVYGLTAEDKPSVTLRTS